MATTTNFGWETPDDTDLVKDGAAAMRTLGSSIDTSFVDLKGGTTGQFLAKASGTDLDFSWANAPGKVLQVVYGSTSTQTTSTSATYADTNLSATITPSATTSKIMILTAQSIAVERNSAAGQYAKLQILRGSTSVFEAGGGTYDPAVGFEMYSPSGVTFMRILQIAPVNYLDSPSSTSALTYKTQFACSQAQAGLSVIAQQDSANSTIILLEIGA
jgi:hypothetical protein